MSRNTTFSVVERIVDIEPHIDPRITGLEVIVLSSGVKLVTGKHYRIGDLGVYLRPGSLIPGWLAEQLWMVGKKRAGVWFEVRDLPIGIKDAPPELKVQSPGLWCGEWYKEDKSAESTIKARDFGVSEVVRDALMDARRELGFVVEHYEVPLLTKHAQASVEKAIGSIFDEEGFIHWRFWRAEWREGFSLDGHFGIVESETPAYVIVDNATREVPFKHDRAYTRQKTRPRSSSGERPADNGEVAVPGGIALGEEGEALTEPDVSATPAAGSLLADQQRRAGG